MNTPDEKVVPESPGLSVPEGPSMLRPAVPADTPALISLAIATELFLPDEVEPLREMLDDLHAGRSGADHRVEVWADDPSGPPVGVVYFGPNDMTDRTWDLLWISVSPDRQGQGIGGELVRFTEAHIRVAGCWSSTRVPYRGSTRPTRSTASMGTQRSPASRTSTRTGTAR